MTDFLHNTHCWIAADSELLQSLQNQTPLVRGKRGSKLALLFSVIDKDLVSSFLLVIVGWIEFTRLWLRQYKSKQTADISFPNHFFVGFGAGAEEKIYQEYHSSCNSLVGRLDQIDTSTFGSWHRCDYFHGVKELLVARRQVLSLINQLPHELKNRRADLLTFACMRIGLYSYMRTWFAECVNRSNSELEFAFISADTPAFAAADLPLTTRYLQHGLIRHSLVLPRFKFIEALTADEKRYFQNRLPESQVNLVGCPSFDQADPSSCVLITSIYGSPQVLARIDPFLYWAYSNGLQIIVRPHPKERCEFWDKYEEAGMLSLDRSPVSFQLSLKRLRPCIVASWFSTTLAESLRYGIIPITVCDSESPDITDTVYPLLKRSIQWPKGKFKVEDALADKRKYQKLIHGLRQGV